MRITTLFLLLGLAGGCQAYSSYQRPQVMVDIVADDGRVFPPHNLVQAAGHGSWRGYIEADYGSNYTIRVRNNTPWRTGLVIAVDGRNIISGDRSDLRPGEAMYIVGPRDSANFRGWRTSTEKVHRFYFTRDDDSYADARGDRTAMGVIAVAAFREKQLRWQEQEQLQSYKRRPGAAQGKAAPSVADSVREESAVLPGTGFGREQYSHARRVSFEPESVPLVKMFYKYEWRTTLCNRRIIDCGQRNRFWPDDQDTRYGFVPYPQRSH